MANLEKFTRYRDNPTLKEPGTSPVATSIEQLEKMTLEERQRVVASIEVLTKYSAALKDEVTKLASQLSAADLDKIKSGLEKSLASRVDEVLRKIGQEDRSLDIKNLWFGIQSNAPEVRWEKPNWNKPYEVEIYVSPANSTDLAPTTLQYTVKSPKDYHIFSDNIEGQYIFVRAKDKATGEYGKFSPVVRVEDRDVRLAKFLEYIQGKIKVTALDEKLIASLKEDIHQATQQQIDDEIGKVRSEVETTKGQIQNTINAVRESSETAWSQLRDTVLRNGTNISNIQRKADGLAEEIKTISAKADNAVAGVENINTVITEKDSAIRREISNALAQVESTRTEVKNELSQTATNLESKLTAEKDARTQLGNNLARTTEKVDQLATESESLKRKTSQIETDVSGNKTKTQQLEENISNLDSSTTKKLESIKSSFNNDHFYNYNMAGGTDGWMLEDFNQDLTAKINTDVGPEDLRYPNILTSIVNTGNIFVKSTQVKPIEREKTYRLTATFKTRSTRSNLEQANLYFLPFDKNGNKHKAQDGLLNRQGGAKYPLIQSKVEVKPDGWVTLTGEISTWSSSYPITTAAEANMIPTPTVFACPALELIGKQGAGSFEVDIAILDLKDISDEKSVSSQIDTVKRTLSDENKALAQQFTSQTSQFKSDVIAQMTELSKSVTEAQKASNTRIDDMNTRLGDSNSKIQRLEQTVNDEKSSNALKIDTLRADFNKSKANQIDFDLDKTPTFEVNPQTKFRIIDKSAATLISRDYVSAYPANKYLKFWGDTLEFNRNNRLPVKSGDKLYASAEIFSKTADVSVYVKYLDENGNLVGRDGSGINLVGSLSTNNSYTKIESDNNLVVPNNTEIKFAQLSISTGKNTLSEEDDSILISNPQLRHYDETAIKSDAKLNDLKVAVSSEIQSYAERTQGIEAELNGRLAQNNIKQTARAEADEVATSKVETAKSELKDSISNIQNTQTTLSNTVKAQAEELKTVESGYKSEIAKANSRIDSTNTTFNDKYNSLSSKTDTLESNYRELDDKYTKSEARNKAERVALVSKDEALTRRLDEQSTKIQGAETKITTLENTQTDDRQAFTNFKRDAESKLNDSSSKISNLEKTTTTLENSIAETSRNLKSEFTNNIDTAKTELSGKIDQNERTSSDQYRTLAERTATLESKADTVDGKISNAISSERSNTLATAKSVSAEVERTLLARLGESEGKITEAKNIAVDAQGKVNGKIGLKLNANGKAVGWSSEVNGESNNFSINADNFKIANGNDDYTPFSIDTANRKIRFNGEVAFTKGTNLLKNPTMSMAISLPNASDISPLPLDSILNWRVSSSSMVEVRRPESNWSPNVVYYPNEVCIDIRNDNKTARALERTGWLYQDVSVTPGNWYMFSGWVASHGSKCRLLIEEINSSGGYIKQIGGTDYVNPSGGRDLSNYTRLFMKFKANSPNIRVGLEQINLANQTTTSVLQSWLFRPMLEECSENATGPSAWSNSNVGTVIDGDQLKTNTISVDKLSFSPSAVNLLVNSQLMPLNPETQDGSPLFWSFYDNASRSRDLCRCQNLGKSEWSGGVDGRVERIYTNNSGPNEFTGAGWRHLIAQDVWLTPGTYIFSFYSANHGANPNRLLNSNFEGSGNRLIPRFERLDSNRNFVPSLNGFATGIQVVERGVIPSGRGDFYYGYGNADRGWIKCNVTASTWYRVGIGVSSSSNSERSELWFGRPMLELVPSTQNLPSLFSHSVTRVDKDSLYVPKLSALSANMGDITAGSLNINNRAKISTDGTLTATGANINGTITATGGSITGDLYVGDRNGGYVLISGSQKAIIVYEGTVPKVRLGKL